MTVAVLIKGFPKDIHKELKLQAVRMDSSLKDLVIRYCQEGLKNDKKTKKGG